MDPSVAIGRARIGREAAAAGETAALAALMLLAVALRLVPVLVQPSLDWPDEIFQATEPAHRLVYGSGLVAWEFQLGIRSWLLPGVIAGIMEAARAVGDGRDIYLPAIAVAFAALGAAPVACVFLWCRRWFGLAGAVVAGTVVATAPDLVYLGGRTLSEIVAAHLLVIALYVIEPGFHVTSRRRIFAGGLLLGLACIIRIQLSPALAVIAMALAAREVRRRLPALLVGGLAAVGFAAVLDAATLGAPLASIWRYVIDNIYYGVSASNGVEPWSFYGFFEFELWQFALAAPLLLALVGAWRMPVMLVAAVVIVAVHSAIDHKEYRFIYPAILLVLVLAGFGLAQITTWAEQTLRRRNPRVSAARAICAAAAVAYWGLLSFQVWTGPGFTVLRNVAHDELAASNFVARDPDVCGVGLSLGLDEKDWIYGSYTELDRNVPRYWFKDDAELAATATAFNTLITNRKPPAQLGYETQQCFGAVCVTRRPGGCALVPMKPLPVPAPLQ